MMSLIRKPSAWVPIALSALILLMELGYLLFSGPPQQAADEGVAAHLFQLWLALELFLVGFFAVSWLPQKPFPAVRVLIIQIVGVLSGMFPVIYFHL